MRCFLLLFFVCSVASVSDKESEIEGKRKSVLDQLTKTRTVLVEGYHLVTRQIITDVYMYRSYRTVSIVFYPVMRDVTDARFLYQAEELHLNNIGSCSPQTVIIKLKRNAYPAVNPDGYDFPKDFIDPASRDDIYTIELTSDGSIRNHHITNPKPGNWFALAYIKWEDPRTQKVEQQGLVADCSTILYTDLQVKRAENIELIDCYNDLIIDYIDVPSIFKCMTIDSIEPISLNISVRNTTTNSQKLLVRIQAEALPTEENYLLSCAFDPKLNNEQTVTFSGNPSSWHYVHLNQISNASSYADCDSYYYRNDVEETENNHTVSELMRDDKGRFFTYDFGLPTTDIQDATSVINITSTDIKSIRFNLNQFIDVGGNLGIEVSLLMSLKYYMGYKRQKKKSGLLGFTETNQYMKAVICMDIGHASIPLKTGHCKYNDKVKPALFVLNTTDSSSIYGKTVIPYPDSGSWFLTSRLFCDDTVCPCRTSHNGSKYYVDGEGSDDDSGENFSGELTSNYTRQGVSNCSASIVLSLSSSSCVNGRCSNHGSCMLNTFGGMVMSFCSCSAGYGAWDCSDSSRMDSRAYMLMAVLLLTLSNILFFLSIYVAIIRLYYTEAMMYAFTMVFSTFYHACDAPAQVAYCITRGNILQFGDFYCGIMCFWVTLLAMSILRDNFRSALQLVGAIVIALLTTWNMHSFMAFLLPVAIGVFILFLSWYVDWRRVRKFSYPKSYYIRHLPAGLVLVSVGLVCYAFLQTEQNYKVVHSVWHAIIAVSVAFLLPDVKREGARNAFLPTPNSCKLPFCRIFSRPTPAMMAENRP